MKLLKGAHPVTVSYPNSRTNTRFGRVDPQFSCCIPPHFHSAGPAGLLSAFFFVVFFSSGRREEENQFFNS